MNGILDDRRPQRRDDEPKSVQQRPAAARPRAPSSSGSGRIVEINLDPVETQRLDKALDTAIEQLGPEPSQAALLASARILAKKINASAPALARTLRGMRGLRIDAAFVNSLPRGTERGKLLAVMIGYGLGFPLQYSGQGKGAIPMLIKPTNDSVANTNSTRDEFNDHSDDSILASEHRTDWIVLVGGLSSARVATYYSPIDEALALLDAETIEQLHLPRYRFGSPASFGVGAVWSGLRPVLTTGAHGRTEIAFPSYRTKAEPGDAAGEQALAKLAAAVKAVRRPFEIEPATALIFNNSRGTHARSPIGDAVREVYRVYAKRSIAALRAATGCEGPVFPLAPLIKENE